MGEETKEGEGEKGRGRGRRGGGGGKRWSHISHDVIVSQYLSVN